MTSLVILSACSTTTKTSTLSKLQSDFNKHKYSAYVTDSLKTQPVVIKAEPSINDKKLKAFKHQIASRKNNSTARLNNVRNQNGLHKVSRGLQQQVSRLSTQNKREQWLKSHSSLDAVLALLIRNNLDIQSAQEQAQASLSKYDQVGFLDDMLSQYAAFTKDISLTGSTQKHKKSVSKGFPFPGLLALKSSIIDQAVEASRLQVKKTTQDAITNARIAYYELQFSKQEIVLTRKNIGLLKSLKEELNNNYSTNTANLSGIYQIDIEIANYRNKLQIAKDKQRSKHARLSTLLNLSPSFTLGKLDILKAEKLPKNMAQLIKIGQTHRVEIARLQTDLEKMKRVISLSEKRFYPDFDAGYSRFQNDKFTKRPKIKKSNFFAKNDAYLTETKQKYKALQLKIQALKTKTADDIQQAVSNYKIQKSTHELYQNKVLPKARTSLDIAKNLYETGETSLVDIIETQELIVDYRLKAIKALKEMNVNMAKIKRLIGYK
ncbi:MAG: TolC family protein [Cocleimonas sp.]|nr:TolC family protein [Cocleimonas sp.]